MIPSTPATIREEKYLTNAEAQRFTRLSHDTLGRLAKRGERTGRLRVGGKILYDRELLEAWLRSRENPPK